MIDIHFEPEIPPEEQLELAKCEVANLLDDAVWKWLVVRIADEHLSWLQIFNLVANNS